MTSEQIDVANQYIQYHTDKFGYDKPNVSFVQGYIEKLVEAGLQPNYFDIIVSNCVVNLSPDKKAVLSEGFKVLKPGGELYFSDVYSDTELSDEIRKDNVLWGECISGALHWKTLHSLAKEVGFTKPHLVSCFLSTLTETISTRFSEEPNSAPPHTGSSNYQKSTPSTAEVR